MSKKVKTGLIIGIVALICVIAIVLVFVFFTDKDDEHKHTLTHSDAVAATCTEDGSVEYWTCTECGKHFADENATEELDSVVVPALGHDFADYEVKTAATCTHPGEEVSTCSRCGEEQSRTIEALGHDWNDGAVTTPATCTQEGVMTYSCSRCGETKTETIDALGHDYIEHAGQPATCTESGWADYVTCTRCDYTTYQPIPSAGHKAEVIPAVAATCTQNGLTEGQKCSVCGEILVEQEVIQAPGHTPVTLPAVAPTCTSTGLTEGQKCAVCDEIIVAQQVIAMTAHEYSDKWSSDADHHWHVCTVCGAEDDVSAHIPDREQPGEDSPVKCSVCGYVIQPATGHIVHTAGDTWYSDGTSHWQTCTGCGIKMNEASHRGGIATCTDRAQCAVCGKEYGELAAHSPVTMPAVAPNCTQTGLTEGKKCSVCGEELVEQEVIPMTEHSYTSEVTKQPTCTEEGVRTYTCSACGDSYTEDIEANGHTIVIDEAVEPTCTDTGLTEGKHCFVCGEILVKQEVVPITEHSYTSEVTKQPTCSQTGERTYTCSACGDSYTASIAALGHQYRVTSRKEATCTQAGEVVYTCTRCGDGYTVKTNASHNYVLVETVAATCTEAGYQLYRCSECEEEFKNIIPAGGGHNYVGTVTLAPTTEREGEMTYTCSVCGDSYTVPLAKLNSGSGYVLLIQDRLPWTTDNNAVILNYLTQSGQIGGWEVVTTQQAAATDLSAFGIIYIANDQTTATYNRLEQLDEELTQFVQGGGVLIYGACDHGWAAGDISYALPGGVSIQNYYSNYNYIVNSAHDIVTGVLTGGEAITDRILYSTYSSHTTFHDLPAGADIILQDAKGDPTLVEYALGNGYVIASGLTWEYTYERTFVDGTSFAKEIYDDLFVYAQTLISGCEHEYLAGETVAPTCSADGYTIYTCTVCGRTYHGDYVEALGHSYTSEVLKQPSCNREGVVIYTCSVCGDSYTESIPMIAHTEVIDEAVEPTCTDTGLTEGKHCSACGEVLVEQQVIPMIAHNYVDEVTKQPTCTEEGVRTYICSACGDSYTESISMTAHNYVDEVTKQPTCTEKGVRTYICSTCGDSYTEDIEANGHTIVIDEAVEPTCTDTGLTEGKHCSVCGEILVKQEEISANGHSYESSVTKQPTCTEKGVLTYTCSVCGDSYTESIPMTAHTEVIDEAVEPTCTATGLTEGKHCSVCGTVLVEQEVVPMTEHTYTSKVTKQPTCTEEGVRTYTCSACGDSYTEDISANGHTVVIDEAVAPTCISTGLTEGKHCSACGEVFIEQKTLPTIDHNYVNGVCTMCGKRDESYATKGLVFTLSDDGTYYSVTDYTGSAKDVYIPSTYNDLPVTRIGDQAFNNCDVLTSITIGNGVTSIGERAFYNCSSLTSITIPNSVTSIGERAFYNCIRLTGITIPDSVTSIGDWAFSSCISLTSITIPDGVTSIGYNAFYNCSRLEGVYITDIAAWCAINFGGIYSNPLCDAHNLYLNGQLVTELVIPDSVTSIGGVAFYYCLSLTSVAIPDSVTSIGSSAFRDCSSLTSISIPDSVTSIGSSVFSGCSGLTSITIPDSVTSIGDHAFMDCSSLTSITIPNSVTSIGIGAFSGCSGLKSITLPFVGGSVKSATDTYQYPFGYIFGTYSYTGGTAATQHYYGSSTDSTTSTTYYIPSSLKEVTITGGNILFGAFSRCNKLTNITIPDSVTSIGDRTFYVCSSLTSITIPDSVTSIGDEAFANCHGVTSITIPDSVTSIGYGVFYYCYSLTSVTIPDSVTSIGEDAFIGCDSLTSIMIPDSVTSIGGSAFSGCSSLTSITIPDSVTSIGNRAFYGCNGLISITVASGNRVYHSAGNCIIETESKTLIVGCGNSVIPSDGSVTSIGDNAFGGCISLTSITIPDSVTSIESYAFSGCSNLTSVKLTNPNGWRCSYNGREISISSSGLSNTSRVATYLTGIYCGYNWKRI